MRNTVIGIVTGVVVGVVVGAAVVGPRLLQLPVESLTDAAEEPAAAVTAPAQDPPVRWKMASAYGSAVPQLGTLAKRIDRNIWRVSDGGVRIAFHEPGALVATDQIFEAVASGAIDAAFAAPSLWGDKVPALNLFASVPFGPSAGEYLAWIYFGGGRELFERLYQRNGIHGLFCGLIAPEAAGWFRREITLPDDLRGLRMRFVGLGAKVMQRLGVAVSAQAGGDIFLGLETGTIDAAQFSMPAIDLKLGFHEMVKNYYFPGWHQPATFFNLVINLGKWQALSAARKAQIEAVCGDNVRHGLAEGEALQFAALKELVAKGVRIRRWPAAVLEALDQAWQEVAASEAEADRDFARVWTSLSDFREDYAIWRELSRP